MLKDNAAVIPTYIPEHREHLYPQLQEQDVSVVYVPEGFTAAQVLSVEYRETVRKKQEFEAREKAKNEAAIEAHTKAVKKAKRPVVAAPAAAEE